MPVSVITGGREGKAYKVVVVVVVGRRVVGNEAGTGQKSSTKQAGQEVGREGMGWGTRAHEMVRGGEPSQIVVYRQVKKYHNFSAFSDSSALFFSRLKQCLWEREVGRRVKGWCEEGKKAAKGSRRQYMLWYARG